MKTLKASFCLLIFFVFSCSSDDWTPQEEPETTTEDEERPAPTTPILISPLDAQTCEEGEDISTDFRRIDFAWEATENTTSYDLNAVNLDTETEHFKSSITTTSDYLVLEKNHPYSWQVISRSMNSSVSTTSTLWQFYVPGNGIINYAPFPATVVKPSSGALVIPTDGKVTLQWEGTDPDDDPLTYTLYFDTTDGLQIPKQEHLDLEVTSIDVNVQPNTLYYWRIKSTDGANSSYTVPLIFQTQ